MRLVYYNQHHSVNFFNFFLIITFYFRKSKYFVGLITLSASIAFTAAFCGMVLSLLKVHRFYRGSGFSIDKARKEFSEGVMSDKNVQQVIFYCYKKN